MNELSIKFLKNIIGLGVSVLFPNFTSLLSSLALNFFQFWVVLF